MRSIFTAMVLSALIIPGAGQLYNREKVKGFIFIGLFVLVLLGFIISITSSLMGMIPLGVTPSPDEVKIYVTRISEQRGDFLTAFWYLILAIWGFSILDAFLGARDRLLKDKKKEPSL